MLALAQRFRQIVYIRYLIVSVGALCVDMGVFLAMLTLSVAATPAAAIGYCAGIVAHWVISSRKVFVGQVAESGIRRTQQKAMFVVSALIGLTLTMAIVWSCERGGIDPRIAKLVAVGISFQATWLLRNLVVFR